MRSDCAAAVVIQVTTASATANCFNIDFELMESSLPACALCDVLSLQHRFQIDAKTGDAVSCWTRQMPVSKKSPFGWATKARCISRETFAPSTIGPRRSIGNYE